MAGAEDRDGPGDGKEASTIEEGGQRYLRKNAAPREIEEDWHAFIDRGAADVWASAIRVSSSASSASATFVATTTGF